MFCDLVGSSEVASELQIQDYGRGYIASFYWAIDKAHTFLKRRLGMDKWPRSRLKYQGDELLVTKNLKGQVDLIPNEVSLALSFFYTLKLYWLISPYNRKRIESKRVPREISCGIHIGDTYTMNQRIVGFDINLAKRVETVSREGYSSNIFVTRLVSTCFNRWKEGEIKSVRQGNKELSELKLLTCAGFGKSIPKELKGIFNKVYISELKPALETGKNRDETNNHAESLMTLLSSFSENLDNWPTAYNNIRLFKNIFDENNTTWGDNILTTRQTNPLLRKFLHLSQSTANMWLLFNIFYLASVFSTDPGIRRELYNIFYDQYKREQKVNT